MKQKISFRGMLLPFFRRLMPSGLKVELQKNRVQNCFAIALLILWLLVFLFSNSKNLTIHK